VRRVLVAAETLKGRVHAAWGVENDRGEVHGPARTTRSLCGVPVNRTNHLFVVDYSDQTCKLCSDLAGQAEGIK
jgi:hypothetical protein